MKKKAFIKPVIAIMLLAVLFSCKKDEEDFTIEDKLVTGTLTYTGAGAAPLEVDPVTHQPLKMRFSFTGTGAVSEMGDINVTSSFTFDFVAGKGYDFVTTYTGSSASDTFIAVGSSVMVGNMVFEMTETLGIGTGKFSKIKGSGGIHVELLPDGSSGTGEISWTVTY